MILRDLDRTVDPCCDNVVGSWLRVVVGLVFGDLWPASFSSSVSSISTIMAEAQQRDVRNDQDRQQGRQACMVLPNVTVLISFFLTEGNKKILIHKEKSRFPFSATAHRDFEIFKKAVLDFCDVQSLAEAKGLGRSMDCSFMRTVRSGTVESFCIRTQRQWENEMALLLERDSILQGMLTTLTDFSTLNYLSLHYKLCPLTACCWSF